MKNRIWLLLSLFVSISLAGCDFSKLTSVEEGSSIGAGKADSSSETEKAVHVKMSYEEWTKYFSTYDEKFDHFVHGEMIFYPDSIGVAQSVKVVSDRDTRTLYYEIYNLGKYEYSYLIYDEDEKSSFSIVSSDNVTYKKQRDDYTEDYETMCLSTSSFTNIVEGFSKSMFESCVFDSEANSYLFEAPPNGPYAYMLFYFEDGEIAKVDLLNSKEDEYGLLGQMTYDWNYVVHLTVPEYSEASEE